MKVLFSGGHLTPALALLEHLQSFHPEDRAVFVGRKYSQPSLKQRSWEEHEVKKFHVPFIPFDSPKLDQQPVWKRPLLLIPLIRSVLRARAIFQTHQPDVFVSFGGFLAVPLAIAAKLCGVPIVTHEQTRAVGLATLWIGRIADRIALSFTDSQRFFPKNTKKVVVTGNPLRAAIFSKKCQTPSWAPAVSDLPLLYVTGGNQGSQFLNILLQSCLPTLVEHWRIVHQCGSPTSIMQYKKTLEHERAKLPESLQSRYVIREWVSDEELCWIYQHAEVALSRSGANTVAEFMQVGLPALFIPLPHAHFDEQKRNAEVMTSADAALILPQKDASTETVLAALESMRKKRKSLRRNATVLRDQLPSQATEHLYQLIHEVATL